MVCDVSVHKGRGVLLELTCIHRDKTTPGRTYVVSWTAPATNTVDCLEIVAEKGDSSWSDGDGKDFRPGKRDRPRPHTHPPDSRTPALKEHLVTGSLSVFNAACCWVCRWYEQGLQRRLDMLDAWEMRGGHRSDYTGSLWEVCLLRRNSCVHWRINGAQECDSSWWCNVRHPGPAVFLAVCIGYSISITKMHQRIRSPRGRVLAPLVGLGLAIASATMVPTSGVTFALARLPPCLLVAITLASTYDFVYRMSG